MNPTSPIQPKKSKNVIAPADLAAAIKNGGRSKHSKWLWFGGFAILGLASTAMFWWWHAQKLKNQPPAYATETLHRGDINLTITATGNLFPTNEVTVGSELSGTTLEVYVDFNSHVTKGQALAKLDSTKLSQQTEISRASVRSMHALVAQSQATLKETQTALARLQELRSISGGKLPAQLEIDTAAAAADRASADLQSAEAQVSQAQAQVLVNETDLKKAIIKSPIDGVVLTRTIEPGQTVAASFTAPQLFVIAEKLERMKLEVAIAEADIGRVAMGQKSTFTVDAWPDRTYDATVSIVSYGSAVTQNVVTYEADLEVNNDDLSLRPGMTATADIRVAESKNVFLVPTSALRFNPTTSPAAKGKAKKSFVQNLIPMPTRNSSRPDTSDSEAKPAGGEEHIWILRNGRPESIAVKLGLSDGHHTEVSGDGLTEGMLIITRANPPST
jgi:HlyD family secretion protein